MSKLKLFREYCGDIHLNNGVVDITDPCYAGDVWCRMSDVKVKPGVWRCYAYFGEDKDWGYRPWICQIVFAEDDDADLAEDKIFSGKSWREIGEIGVDAGLAGFFDRKPNFSDSEWGELCNWMFDETVDHNPEKVSGYAYLKDFGGHDGFWTESGCGDGGYTVHAIRNNKREIIALEIRF